MRFYFKTKDGDIYFSDKLDFETLEFIKDTSCMVYANQKIYTHGLGGNLDDEEWLLIILKAKPLNIKNT